MEMSRIVPIHVLLPAQFIFIYKHTNTKTHKHKKENLDTHLHLEGTFPSSHFSSLES